MSIFRKKHNNQQPTEEQNPLQENEPQEPQEPQELPQVSYKTIEHINGYPLVQQTKEILDAVAVARVIKANTLPTANAILSSKPVKFVEPVTKIVDNMANTSLNLTEKVVPSLKTKTYQRLGEEAMIPYNLTSSAVGKTVDTTVSLAENYIYEPTHNQILKFRQFYNEKVYDTHGKPLIRGSMDPVVSPCNKWYESWIKATLPEGQEVPTNGFSNELDRSFALTFNLIQRFIPVFNKKTKETLWAPCNYVKHVNEVLNVNLDKQEDLSIPKSWTATKDSVQELNHETVNYLKSISPIKTFPMLKKKVPAAAEDGQINEAEQIHITDENAEGNELQEQVPPIVDVQYSEPIEAI